ncbi:2-dehydropantoate 2-reductase [Vibrio sp. S4M6]|uniref:2-dehydropantoate 2-reductase n=1 Tax=Vibrio sinus TaxID=2946865 RepID=UPI00202A6866|nr:2-dehydropantoate 2-reductase [Vibrio sinus]MCL9782209.1 2-dehydropantoate 2-reductase [Vibrio sinus]
MNIVVVGAGAIGSLWAIHLKQAGHQVGVWSRSNESTIEIQLDDDKPLSFRNRNTDDLNHADLVLITVKAWQVEQAIYPILSHLHQDCILMFMHNGMGAVDKCYPSFEHHPVLLATTAHGAFRPSPHRVNHTGKSTTQVGAFNDKAMQCEFIADVFNDALPTVSWSSNIKQALWYKLVVNCAINPLTGIEMCQNGQLSGEQYQSKIQGIIAECIHVMQAEDIEVDERELTDRVHQVIKATAQNYSSMQQDIFYNRKTEIDYITGYVLQLAKQYHLDVPVNLSLYQKIKAKERHEDQNV